MLDNKQVRGTRERVLEAALDEFADYGLAGARVDRIARRAGVNKAMIYYHFDSKEALYDHVLKAHMEVAVATLTAEIAEDLPLEEILRIIAEYHRRGLESADKFSRIVLREFAAGSESIKRVLPELAGKENLRRLIVRKIQEGKQQGKYRDVDIRQAMIAFVGMSLFYLMIAPMANQVWGIEDDSEFRNQRSFAIVDLFMRGLETR